MGVPVQTNAEQATLWNGTAGRAWVETQAALDQMFRPFEDLLAETAAAAAVVGGSRVLDIGCGTGATTLAVARRVVGSRCTGVDLSEPMIAAARTRAERAGLPVSFIRADAQTHAFEPASFDTLISRFGVMFFEDPVQAFANLRQAARDGAGLHLIAWRSPAENPFMTTAERAAAPLLPNLPPRQPDAPGQFAFADRQRVERILDESGWGGIAIEPIDVVCTFAEPDLIRYLTWLGPVGRYLQEADEQTRTDVGAVIRAAFDPFVFGAEVRFVAACWMIEARA